MADGSNAHKRLNGWRYDPVNLRLDYWYKGTLVGYVNASGIFNAAAAAVTGAYADNVKNTFGTDADGVIVQRSTVLNANTTLSGVVVGTPVTPAVAANSLLIANITADADLLLATQTGGNTHAAMWVDASAAITRFYSGAGVEILKLDSAAATLTGTLTVTGAMRSSSPTAPIGYATGAGSAKVTQITTRATGVAVTTVTGQIQTDTSSLAAEASAVFVVTATGLIAATDTVVVSQVSGSNGGNTDLTVYAVAADQFSIRVSNNNASGGTAETGAIVMNYAIIKGSLT